MRIRTLDQVHGRTADGRVYSAGEGAVTDVDDDDNGMVDLMRQLAKAGLVEIIEADDGTEEEPEQKETVVEAPVREPKKAVTQPRTPKAGRTQ